MKKHPPNLAAKGRRLQNMVKAILESQGSRLEMASPRIVRYTDKETGELKTIATHHDLLGLWDFIVVTPTGTVYFIQVTTHDNVSARRKKIIQDGFSHNRLDEIWGYVGGRNAYFQIYRGPDFQKSEGEVWKPIKKEKNDGQRKE